MRDQPKPAGEWTVENAGNSWTIIRSENGNELVWFSRNDHKAQRIADAHNASIAAEREKCKSAEDLTRDNGRLHGELAKSLRENEQLRKQLAAEKHPATARPGRMFWGNSA